MLIRNSDLDSRPLCVCVGGGGGCDKNPQLLSSVIPQQQTTHQGPLAIPQSSVSWM